jgi:hypothetical protein
VVPVPQVARVQDMAPPVQEVREAPAVQPVAKPVPARIETAPGNTAACTAEELLAYLQQRTEGSSMLHITLLDCTRIQSFDGKVAVLAVDCRDKFGHTHLNRPQSMAQMKELAREFCGSDIQIRVETAEFKGAAVAEAHETAGQAAPEPSGPVRPIGPINQATEPAVTPVKSTVIAEDEPKQVIYMSPELREKTMREVKGEALRKFLDTQPELKDLVEKVKQVFKVEDSSFTFRAPSF